MRSALKKDPFDPQTGHFGTSRFTLNQFDVSTQSDIQHQNFNYGSEDEIMGRLYGHEKRADPSSGKSVAHYSKQDILEQYCISDRGLGALENGSYSFFGCLSSHHNSSCSSRSASSFLTACVRQKVSSDENLYELYKRHPYEYAPFPKKQRYPWSPVTSEMYSHDHDLKSSYFRRKPYADPSRYTWMPSDEESIRMEKPKSIIDLSYRNHMIPQSKKHVSFARSHTLTSFDDAMSSLSSSSSHLNRITRSQERLLEVKKVDASQPITKQPEFIDKIVLEKVKRGPMKTQATQTDNIMGRKQLAHVNLSPRTVQRVKMVSQAAQTNGINGRKLIKSLSEAGHKFPSTSNEDRHFFGNGDHEPLHRTQSDEPPRSPYIDTSPTIINPPEDQPQSESSSISKSEDHGSEDSVEAKNEIFIDFKPQVATGSGILTKPPLVKTFSDGVILMEKRRINTSEDGVVPNMRSYSSVSHENIQIIDEVPKFVPHFQKAPIKHEGICKPLEENIYSSIDGSINPQDSIDEEFHENLIYRREYNRQDSLGKDLDIITERSPSADESVVPSIYLRTDMSPSPFASSDSLANDARDQSDDIWNESQVTVLQVDSGTDNGTLLSTPENVPLGIASSTAMLTPSSRRKHLLMLQHQQRSSIDTEDLDKEGIEQEIRPKLIMEKSPNKLKVPNTLQVITKQSQSCLRIGPPRTLSPSRRRRMSESPPVLAESPLPAVVPDLLLARTDSCKTNTDLSESTTTDDYITANSGTDSSRKSASFQGSESHAVKHVLQDPTLKITLSQDMKKIDGAGSSFDSAKGSLDAFTLDDMVVPSISPSMSSDRYLPVGANTSIISYSHSPVPQIRTGRSTPSEDSSSCGSYSVGGSTPDLLERYSVPSENQTKIWSDDEERSIQYSSSGYYESPLEDDLTKREDHVSTKRRKEFQLELANNSKSGSSCKAKHKSSDTKPSSQQENLKVTTEKGKRSKVRTRSPLQGHKKNFQGRKSPHKDKTFYSEDRSYKATSDESSTGREYTISQTSPRKSKKNKDPSRRKSLPRSPIGQKSQKKSDVDYQPSSLPGSLSRRKSVKKSTQPDNSEYKHTSAYLKQADAQQSPTASAKDTTTLKALSAESLRSVSPGSDSVFYSEPNSHTADHQMHCLHCGKEVELNTDEAEKSISSNGHQPVIVQPPAGFEDSPKIKVGRLFKKSDKRLRSEEKSQHEQKRHRYRPDMRAKSEERGGATATLRGRLRPMQRSPYCSKEHLKAADSSPSILPGAPEEDNDQGIYPGSYSSGQWFCINEADKVLAVFSPTESESIRRTSISSTESEHDFCKRYQGVAHRVVHRKPYVDMYKRLYFKSFESDKTIVVQRDSGEFGFRIHGSKPVVVTAIEQGTPAESSGLEVGDIIISVNGVNVLDRSHSDVVQIAHAGSDTLTLEVARTSYALNTAQEQSDSWTLYSGYLWKMSGYAKGNTTNKWTRRWFCLKKDNCLYYYKTDSDKQPVGVVMLFDQEIRELDTDTEPSKANKFVIQKEESVPLYLAADTLEGRSRWVEVIGKTLNECQAVDDYLEETKRNLTLSPNSISDPDCFGYLIKLGTQWKSWSRRYCVLKDAALYFYQDSNSSHAFGVALLHGYRVQQSSSSKKHSFEIVPPDPTKKHYYFHAESDTDRRRWISALEYSIDRWVVHQ